MTKYKALIKGALSIKPNAFIYVDENTVEFNIVWGEDYEDKVSICIRKEGSKYSTFISGVLDTDIRNSEAKEIYDEVVKEQGRRISGRKRLAWASLGVFEG
ncbi:MAG: hypothetical protein ACRCZ0_09470 [Cetobacterium sp.]